MELNGFIALIVLYLQNDEVLSFDTEYSNDLSYVKNFFQLDYNVLIISLSKQQQRLGVKKHEFFFPPIWIPKSFQCEIKLRN